MDRARAMYLGGKEIYAEDEYLNYYSYKELGLRCSVCGEPVHLKKGLNKKPHFAHFPSTDSKQVEECELRLSSHTESTQKSLNNFIVNREQRLDIFQQYFLNLIESSNCLNAIKKIDYSIVDGVVLKDLAQEFTRQKFVFTKNLLIIGMQERIILEAIDYLCVKSTLPLLKKLIFYSLCEINYSSNLDWEDWIEKRNYSDVFSKLLKIIFNANWIEVLQSCLLEKAQSNNTSFQDKKLINVKYHASMGFTDTITLTGVKLDGSFGTVNITSQITVSDTNNEWFSLTVGYLTTVKATNLDKFPSEIYGQKYKRPSEKITVIKPLITFQIDRAGKISNTPPSADWTRKSGLGGNYGSFVFPSLSKLLDKWDNPLSLLFALLFTKATRDTDNTVLNETNSKANFKSIEYKALSLEQRLETLAEHHSILVGLRHPSAGNFSVVASKAKAVLEKMKADKLVG